MPQKAIVRSAIHFWRFGPKMAAKIRFHEKLHRLALDVGNDLQRFWDVGVMFYQGDQIIYKGSVLANNLHLKPNSIARNIRGPRRGNGIKTRRMKRREFETIFGDLQCYRENEVQIAVIPGFNRETTTFDNFSWKTRGSCCPPDPEVDWLASARLQDFDLDPRRMDDDGDGMSNFESYQWIDPFHDY